MNEATGLLAPLFWASLIAMVVAQGLKPLWDAMAGRAFRARRAFDSGGMPSSHTALVTTLTLGVWVLEGAASPVFSVVLIFSAYFVFEATGLRQEVGHQARLLNDMVEELVSTHHLGVDRRRLRELVGHTWTEVLGGGVVGFGVFLVLREWIAAGGR